MENRYKAVLALGSISMVVFFIAIATGTYVLAIAVLLFTTFVLGLYMLGEANVPGAGSLDSHREPPDSHTSPTMRARGTRARER
jgi:hypothetical protein